MEYSDIIKKIESLGEPATVKINDQTLKAMKYKDYYVIQTNIGKRIYDGEHIIEPNFRVYDTHLGQYIYYDYPLEKLAKTFNTKIEVSKINQESKLLKTLHFIDFTIFIGILYLIITNSNYLYWSFVAYGVFTLIEAIVEKKEKGSYNKLSIIGAIFIILIGLFGILH